MSAVRPPRGALRTVFEHVFVRHAVVRYAFAVVTVAATAALRMGLRSVTGTGAPFMLFFGAVALSSLVAGPGPGLLATVLGASLGAFALVVRAGHSTPNALFRSALFSVDALIVVYLSVLVARGRREAESAAERLRLANDATAIGSWDLEVATGTLRWLPDIGGGVVPEATGGQPASLAQWLALIHPDDRAGFERAQARALDPAGPGTMSCESRVVRPDGAVRWLSWVGRTYFEDTAGGRAPVRQVGTAIDLTERREREEALRELSARASRSEMRLRELIELAPDAFFLADLTGRYTDVNQAACRMLGYTRDELIGKTAFDLVSPEEVPRLAVARAALLEPGQVLRTEWTKRRKNGTLVPVEVSSNILPDGSWQAFARDISGRKRVEEERQKLLARERLARQQTDAAFARLRDSEERFRLTIDNAPIGMALVTLDGRFARVNAALCEIVGYTAPELERLRFQDITHPDDLEPDLAFAKRLKSGEIPRCQFEKRYLRKDGGIVSVLLSISTLGDGMPSYYITQVEDISERKRVEQEQRFLAEAGSVLASSLDYEQTLTTLCRLVVRDVADWCVVEIVGEQRDEPLRLKVACADPSRTALGAQMERIQIDPHRPHLVRPVLETGRPLLVERMTPEAVAAVAQSAEHLRLLRDIDPRSVMALPLKIREQLLGVLVFISSTPARLYGEADLRFAGAIAERAALAIENGRHYREAVHATRVRDEVLGVVAHDLRNPLSAILMQATALERRGAEPERRNQKPRQTILRAANRMNRLIQDLLDVTLIEARELGVERSRISTRQLLGDALEAQRPLAASTEIELRLDLVGDPPDVWGDPHRLCQVLENLVGNAIKFTPGGGRVIVGAAPRAREVLFWVADTGCGISSEGLPHVFDRFWQQKKAGSQGAGLGLPITRGIVEAHGGRIWVESTLGRGSVFFFTIPVAAGAEAPRPDAMH
jgi:PAS domain S-box-containing protein